jgi:hypothetical protein
MFVTFTPFFFGKKMGELQNEVRLRNHLRQLVRLQVILRLDNPALSCLGMCDIKDCLAVLGSQLHVPRKIMPFFGPTYVAPIKVMAKREKKLDNKVGDQQSSNKFLPREQRRVTA